MASAEPSATVPSRLARCQLLLDTSRWVDVKDPCAVRVGRRWHLFGTGVHLGYRYDILHAIAARPEGPWRVRPPSVLPDIRGGCVAAPAVVAEGQRLHLFLQTQYNVLGGVVEHLVSDDGGTTFTHHDTALTSVPGTGEAGIYDPHPCEVAGTRYLVYSGFSVVGRPDLYLARSLSGGWEGPWERLGCILHHEHVTHHNQHDDPAYEWGLEGGQLVELPDGRVLLNAVCFLAGAPPGDRQRVFFAVAPQPTGVYDIIGPVLDPLNLAGEVGHATAVIDGGTLLLYFQERVPHGKWRYGLASARLDAAPPEAADEDRDEDRLAG